MTVDYFSGTGNPCWFCASPDGDVSIVRKVTPELVLRYESIDFLPEDSKPVGASNVMVAGICGHLVRCLDAAAGWWLGLAPVSLIELFVDLAEADGFHLDRSFIGNTRRSVGRASPRTQVHVLHKHVRDAQLADCSRNQLSIVFHRMPNTIKR